MFQPDFDYITNVPKMITYVPMYIFKEKLYKRKEYCWTFFEKME